MGNTNNLLKRIIKVFLVFLACQSLLSWSLVELLIQKLGRRA